ncbi:MAG TPA: PhoH family protein [Elusimicrobiota bacterium]|nr:PhoH family protein [Elusimicrobiota bacterium]
MVTKKVHLADSSEALLLFGQHDRNLRAIENAYGVQVFGRGHILSIRGAPGKVEKALLALEEMRQDWGRENHGVEPPDVPVKTEAAAAYTSSLGKSIRPKTANQKAYVEAIDRSDLVVAIGPAGTGKSYLAVACALAALKDARVSKIVLTRPVVEAGEKLGFLPGDFYDKVNPYLRPLYDAFYAMLGPDRFRLYRDEETIEIVPLAYMRGRTLENAFIILDEGQNATTEQMKMFLTRTGMGSKVVVNGDITQIDLANRRHSGLVNLPQILKGIGGIQVVHLTENDVVRHPMVREIVRAYDDWEKAEERTGRLVP